MKDVKALIDNLERLEAESTPGPWDEPVGDELMALAGPVGNTTNHHDAAFICASRNALPSLLKAIRAGIALMDAKKFQYECDSLAQSQADKLAEEAWLAFSKALGGEG